MSINKIIIINESIYLYICINISIYFWSKHGLVQHSPKSLNLQCKKI